MTFRAKKPFDVQDAVLVPIASGFAIVPHAPDEACAAPSGSPIASIRAER
jgi:hypothetical protein